jgi:hypothetical protein
MNILNKSQYIADIKNFTLKMEAEICSYLFGNLSTTIRFEVFTAVTVKNAVFYTAPHPRRRHSLSSTLFLRRIPYDHNLQHENIDAKTTKHNTPLATSIITKIIPKLPNVSFPPL